MSKYRVTLRQALDLGRVVATPGALEAVSRLEINHALFRHLHCDWGDVCDGDWQSNNHSFWNELRILSAYHTAGGVKFWIITEADRSYTTVLLPDKY